MSVTRRDVLERLAATTEPSGRTTTVAALAATLDADEAIVAAHVDALVACELACRHDDGTARVTVTGDELLALDIEGAVVVVDCLEADST